MRRACLGTVASLLLAVVAGAQRSTWIVDPGNGPGTNFTSLQAAADAPIVLPADVLVLRSGPHGRLQTSKPLVLIGTAASVIEHVDVSSIPAGSEFVLSGARVLVPFGSIAGIELRGCQGRLVVTGVSYISPSSGVPWQRLAAVGDCSDVEFSDVDGPGAGVFLARTSATLRRCVLVDGKVDPPVSSSGLYGLEAQQSDFEVVDCRLSGIWSGVGSPGVRVIDGTARFLASGYASTSVAGGLTLSGGGTGPSISILRGHVETSPLVRWTGAVENSGGMFATRSLPALGLTLSQGTATASLFTEPGTPAIIAFGFGQPPLRLGSIGRLRLNLQPGLCGLVAANVPSTRSLVTAEPVPSSLALTGTMFAAQGLALLNGELVLSNGAALVIE